MLPSQRQLRLAGNIARWMEGRRRHPIGSGAAKFGAGGDLPCREIHDHGKLRPRRFLEIPGNFPATIQLKNALTSPRAQGPNRMSNRKQLREAERVIRRVMKKVEKYDHIGKTEFEEILDKIIEQVHKNTGIEMARIGEETSTVLADLPNEYGQMPEDMKSWDALIGYLYAKYLKVLGVLE